MYFSGKIVSTWYADYFEGQIHDKDILALLDVIKEMYIPNIIEVLKERC